MSSNVGCNNVQLQPTADDVFQILQVVMECYFHTLFSRTYIANMLCCFSMASRVLVLIRECLG